MVLVSDVQNTFKSIEDTQGKIVFEDTF